MHGLPPAELAPIPEEWKRSPGDASNAGLSPRTRSRIASLHARYCAAERYYDLATDYLWATHWARPGWRCHREIWRLHCEGMTQAEIAAKTGKPRSTVGDVLALHRQAMLRQPAGQ